MLQAELTSWSELSFNSYYGGVVVAWISMNLAGSHFLHIVPFKE